MENFIVLGFVLMFMLSIWVTLLAIKEKSYFIRFASTLLQFASFFLLTFVCFNYVNPEKYWLESLTIVAFIPGVYLGIFWATLTYLFSQKSILNFYKITIALFYVLLIIFSYSTLRACFGIDLSLKLTKGVLEVNILDYLKSIIAMFATALFVYCSFLLCAKWLSFKADKVE